MRISLPFTILSLVRLHRALNSCSTPACIPCGMEEVGGGAAGSGHLVAELRGRWSRGCVGKADCWSLKVSGYFFNGVFYLLVE